jgi:hypothetical protein
LLRFRAKKCIGKTVDFVATMRVARLILLFALALPGSSFSPAPPFHPV